MQKNQNIIDNIRTTMALDGLNITSEDVGMINSFLNHEITEQEGIEKIKMEILSKM